MLTKFNSLIHNGGHKLSIRVVSIVSLINYPAERKVNDVWWMISSQEEKNDSLAVRMCASLGRAFDEYYRRGKRGVGRVDIKRERVMLLLMDAREVVCSGDHWFTHCPRGRYLVQKLKEIDGRQLFYNIHLEHKILELEIALLFLRRILLPRRHNRDCPRQQKLCKSWRTDFWR